MQQLETTHVVIHIFFSPTAKIDKVWKNSCVCNKIGENGTEYCFKNTEDLGGVVKCKAS